jgi:hypothetical protein
MILRMSTKCPIVMRNECKSIVNTLHKSLRYHRVSHKILKHIKENKLCKCFNNKTKKTSVFSNKPRIYESSQKTNKFKNISFGDISIFFNYLIQSHQRNQRIYILYQITLYENCPFFDRTQ